MAPANETWMQPQSFEAFKAQAIKHPEPHRPSHRTTNRYHERPSPFAPRNSNSAPRSLAWQPASRQNEFLAPAATTPRTSLPGNNRRNWTRNNSDRSWRVPMNARQRSGQHPPSAQRSREREDESRPASGSSSYVNPWDHAPEPLNEWDSPLWEPTPYEQDSGKERYWNPWKYGAWGSHGEGKLNDVDNPKKIAWRDAGWSKYNKPNWVTHGQANDSGWGQQDQWNGIKAGWRDAGWSRADNANWDNSNWPKGDTANWGVSSRTKGDDIGWNQSDWNKDGNVGWGQSGWNQDDNAGWGNSGWGNDYDNDAGWKSHRRFQADDVAAFQPRSATFKRQSKGKQRDRNNRWLSNADSRARHTTAPQEASERNRPLVKDNRNLRAPAWYYKRTPSWWTSPWPPTAEHLSQDLQKMLIKWNDGVNESADPEASPSWPDNGNFEFHFTLPHSRPSSPSKSGKEHWPAW